MEATKKRFVDFLKGHDRKFIIPVYQRNYDWRKEHCQQLYLDLLNVSRQKNRNTHFFGSIVALNAHGTEFIIIDGQQRVTTVMLLLLAMIHHVQETGSGEIKVNLIRNDYLVHEEDGELKLKLKPIRDDEAALIKIFKNDPQEYLNSKITKNYQYFREVLKKSTNNITVSDLLQAIEKLEIVLMTLQTEENDDPQAIFESLNSTGLALTEADKVRNFILMKLDAKTQQNYYENYWNPIEKATHYNVSPFLRDYLTYRMRQIPNIGKVYSYFKDYFSTNPWKIDNETLRKEAFFKDFLLYSGYYDKIVNSRHERSDINQSLTWVNQLDTKVAIPFLLEVFYYNDKTQKSRPVILSDTDLLEILRVIESLVIRRFICDIPTNGLNKLFMVLGKDVKEWSNYKEEYVNILKYVLTHKETSLRFPSDTEMREKMPLQDFYKMRTQNKMYIFTRMENYKKKESIVDLQRLINEKKLTFEHIMPKKLTDTWKKELGSGFEKVYKDYLNTIGNLTFTVYNSELGNKSFNEKKVMEGGYQGSNLFLNRYVASKENWNEETIKERSNLLTNRAIEIWKSYDNVIIKSTRKKNNSALPFRLDGDTDVTGYSIKAFSLSQRQKILVGSWVEFYEQVATELYNLDRERFRELLMGDDFITGYIGTENTQNELRLTKIAEDVFIYSNLSAKDIVKNTLTIFNGLSIGVENVRIFLQEK